MAVTKILVIQCECERCGHKWNPNKQSPLPEICPDCKSANWNKPRITKK